MGGFPSLLRVDKLRVVVFAKGSGPVIVGGRPRFGCRSSLRPRLVPVAWSVTTAAGWDRSEGRPRPWGSDLRVVAHPAASGPAHAAVLARSRAWMCPSRRP